MSTKQQNVKLHYIDVVFNAIAWVHSVGDKASPTKDTIVAATLKGLQRKKSQLLQRCFRPLLMSSRL